VRCFFSGYGWWYIINNETKTEISVAGFPVSSIIFPFSNHQNGDRRNPVRTTGYFSLEPVDIASYSITKDTTNIQNLFPCADSPSNVTFPKLEISHVIGSTEYPPEECIFVIDSSQNPIFKFSDDQNKKQSKESVGSKRLKSLEKFLNDFGNERKKIGLDFAPLSMKCNINDLLAALQKWAKKRDKDTQELWDINEIDGKGSFWKEDKRKKICQLLPQGYQNDREENYFKIVNF